MSAREAGIMMTEWDETVYESLKFREEMAAARLARVRRDEPERQDSKAMRKECAK